MRNRRNAADDPIPGTWEERQKHPDGGGVEARKKKKLRVMRRTGGLTSEAKKDYKLLWELP